MGSVQEEEPKLAKFEGGPDLTPKEPSPSSSSSPKYTYKSVTIVATNSSSGTSKDNYHLASITEDPSSSNAPAKQLLATQVTDQAGGATASSGSPSYRIPSYVFDRTKSTAPMEWSVASNESLFSIQMGNTSFTRDYGSWMTKSGELGMPGDSNFSGSLIDYSSYPHQATKPTEIKSGYLRSDDISLRSRDVEGRFLAVEAKAPGKTKEAVKGKGKESKNGKSPAVEETQHASTLSQRSDDSVKSFAFPILTGDADHKSGSLSVRQTEPKKPLQPRPEPLSPKLSQHMQPQAPNQQTLKINAKANTNANAENSKWLSCFPCCNASSIN